MSKLVASLVLGVVLLTNACTPGTVTASSRIEGGNPAMSLGPIGDVDSPRNVERPTYERPIQERATPEVRENPIFRIESDCWRCR